MVGVFLTAYYAFRLIFIVLFPRGEIQEEPSYHGGRVLYWAMGLPLVILAAVTVVLGFLEEPLREFLSGSAVPHQSGHHAWLPYLSAGLAVLGLGLAWFEFGRRASPQIGFVERIPFVRDLFAQRWYLDHAYRKLVDLIIDRGLARGCTRNEDKVINEGIDGFSHFTVDTAHLLSLLQSGKLRYNLIVMFGALALVAFYFLFA
jgi:NADH-quinone oxidoreductase subunit L